MPIIVAFFAGSVSTDVLRHLTGLAPLKGLLLVGALTVLAFSGWGLALRLVRLLGQPKQVGL